MLKQANERRVMTVYGYARVSTARQADEGESLTVQERTIAGYAMMRGLDAPVMFTERGVSGSVPFRDRPEGAAMLGVLRQGDIIVTAKLDRMFRSALDALDMLATFRRTGVSLHMIDLGGDVVSDGVSKLVFTILSAVAEAERDRIRERIATVKRDQRARGRYLGGVVPVGHTVGEDGALRPDPTLTTIQDALATRRNGVTFRAVQADLAARGIKVSLAALHRIAHNSD